MTTKQTNSTNSKSKKGNASKGCKGSKSASESTDSDPDGSYTGNPSGWGKYARPVQDADDL